MENKKVKIKEFIVKKIPWKELKVYDFNTLKDQDQDIKKLKKSILHYDFAYPLFCYEKYIIDGAGRKKALSELEEEGYEIPEIPVYFLTGIKNLEEAKEYTLTASSSYRKITRDSFKNFFGNMDFGNLVDKIDIGINLDDILKLDEKLGDKEYLPIIQKEAVSKIGDLWVLGNHRLICGDATLIDTLQNLMNEEKADLWITDPPYNVSYEGKTKEKLKIKNDEMEDENFRKFLKDSYQNADIFMREGASYYIWHADSEGYNFRGACRDVGWKIRQCLIWAKQTMVLGRQDYHWQHEPCLYGWKDGAPHFWNSDRKQTTLLQFERPKRSIEHPTMKPVDLFEYLILNNTKKGDIVLDSFAGSGTTLIACEKNQRKGRLIEFDPLYCDVIIRRWEKYSGETAVLSSSKKTFKELESLIL